MPNGLSGFYEVAVGAQAVYLQVHGLASMNNCLCVRDFLDDVIDARRDFLVINVADCTGMDSTFMGVIAGVATYRIEGQLVGVAVVNAAEPLAKLLTSVGLTELIFLDPEPFDPPNAEFHILEERTGEAERLKLIHAAHEHLIEISDDNESIFGDLLNAIEDEMKHRGILPK